MTDPIPVKRPRGRPRANGTAPNSARKQAAKKKTAQKQPKTTENVPKPSILEQKEAIFEQKVDESSFQIDPKVKVFDQNTTAAIVFEKLVQGYSRHDIAREMNIELKRVNEIVNEAVKDSEKLMVHWRMNWLSLTMARTEVAMKKLMRRFSQDDAVDHRDYEDLERVVKLQESIMSPKATGQQANTIVNQQFLNYEPTMTGSSALYSKGLADDQLENYGRALPELEAEVIATPERSRALDNVVDDGL